MKAARLLFVLLSFPLLPAACSSGNGEKQEGTAAKSSHGLARLLDDPRAWTIESSWDPETKRSPEEGLAPAHAFDFEDGTPGGFADAGLTQPLGEAPALKPGAKPQPGPPAHVAEAAALDGAKGLRFEQASGVAFAILPLHPDTPYVFSARVRRGVDPAELAAGEGNARKDAAAALARDAGVGGIAIWELHQVPPAGTTMAGLLASIERRENTRVTQHLLAASGRDATQQLRLEFRSSIFTSAIAIGLFGGNPGWWCLKSCTHEGDAAPAGAVDFDDVRLFELPLARWLATATSIEQDDLPCGSSSRFVRKVHLLGEARRALLAPPGTRASIALELPAGKSRLAFGYGVLEERRPAFGTAPIEFTATLERPGAPPRELLRAAVTAAGSVEASAWHDCRVELDGEGGAARLVLATRGETARGEVAAFSEPTIAALRPAAELPRNVLLVSIDTLRADRVGCYGYARADGERTTPSLDEFAAGCLRFANARTVAPFTLPSHATMFTGLLPRVHRVTRAGRRLTSGVHPLLAEEFAAAGYATGAFTGGAFVSYEHGFHQGFDRYSILDPFLSSEDPYRGAFPRPGDRAWNDAAYAHHDRAAIGRWLDAQEGRPFFLFVHTYVAHNYHPPLATERRFVRGDPTAVLGPARDLKWLDLNVAAAGARVAPEIARVASDVYDAAVATADAEVGALLEELRGRGLLDRTVVAIVSDHGEELGEHGGLLHGRTLYEELLRVPFLLRVPGLAPGVVDAPIDLADLAPTLREAAGLAAEPRCEGRSVLARVREGSFEDAFLAEVTAPGLSCRYALATDRLKLIETPTKAFDLRNRKGYEEREYTSRLPPQFELFDLESDARERTSLLRLGTPGDDGRPAVQGDDAQPAPFAGMKRSLARRREDLDALRARWMPDARAIEYSASADAQQQLRNVGYAIGADAGADDDE